MAGLVEKLTTAARVHWKHRIAVPAGEVQVVRRSDGTNEVLYITTDHLGSTDTVTDASATVLARESFGAWGARRAANWQGNPSSAEWQSIANTTRRGYTGHEHLDNVLLVHMNGRVYDPAIGRFMSANPIGIDAWRSQSWNRYAYVQNRPLRFTDPTGYTDDDAPVSKILCKDCDFPVEMTVEALKPRDPGVQERLNEAHFRNELAGILGRPSAGLPLNEDGTPEMVVTATRVPANTPRRDKPQGESALCKIKDTVAGTAGGAVGLATIAVMTGQPELVLPALGVGALFGGAVSTFAPDGGFEAFVVGTFASAMIHVRTGPSSDVFAEIASDGVSASVPNGAMTTPVGAGLGAVSGFIKPAFALGRVPGAIVGSSAGGMAAINSFLAVELVEAAFEEFLGCSP